MNAIRSKLHSLYTYTLDKASLCAFDDKRYILDNGKDTIAHGYNSFKIHYSYNITNYFRSK